MWPYCSKNAGIFKCPADRSTIVPTGGPYAGTRVPRVRSISMNIYLGGFHGELNPSGNGYICYRKYSEIVAKPGPSKIFVFIDEREDAINWGNFETEMAGSDPYNEALFQLTDLPASYHGQACGFSFADGHAEIHRWRDPRTMPPLVVGGLIFNGSSATASPRNKDVAFLQDAATRKK